MARDPAVLLISPGILRWEDVDFGVPHLVSLGGYVAEHTGARVEILDLNYEGGDVHDLSRQLDDLGPFLLIGVSAYSSFDLLRVRSLARFLRERHPDVPLVTGGYHASALPDDLLDVFDRVIPGEAELEMRHLVEQRLGGAPIEPGVAPQRVVPDLDELPPYRWELLERYWPHATRIGRKLQIYLSRGCPYRCAFCMERAKSGYAWRAYSPDRAVDELARLARFTDLSAWTINLADPLFGFRRRWRREVLAGIVERDLLPMGFWTLTRSDDLDDEDIELLGRARFAIGIGLESGSPDMLRIMQKGNQPGRYLDAVRRLARLSQRHGLYWATNVIVGHPGETLQTAMETRAFLDDLFLSGPSSHGWLSVDPFRLYPGSQVHEQQAHYEEAYGTRFHHPTWWRGWYDGPFRAQHLDPSGVFDYEARVRWMFDEYGPLVQRIHARFRNPGGARGRVFESSQLAEVDLLTAKQRDVLIERGRSAGPQGDATTLAVPIGLDVRDRSAQQLEQAVRASLDRGMVIADALLDALFANPPHRWLAPVDAAAMVANRIPAPPAEGWPPTTVGLDAWLVGMQALAPAPGERAVDLFARTGHVAAVLASLVGPRGEVVAVAPDETVADALRRRLSELPQVTVVVRGPAERLDLPGTFDVAWLGAALPRVPPALRARLSPGGRAFTAVGPRFRAQDLVIVDAGGAERVIARDRWPVLGGPEGWLPWPGDPAREGVEVRRAEGTARLFAVLAAVDLGPDAAALGGERSTAPWAHAIARAWSEAPGRLALQALGLVHLDVNALFGALGDPPPALRDEPGRRLCEAVIEGLRHIPAPSGFGALAPTVIEQLEVLREQLWAPQGLRPPRLVLLDVPALGRHARAATVDGERRIATSLAMPAEHVLMQVFHEEMHPVTDPVVLAEAGASGDDRDTRPGTQGFALHQRLEQTAVDATAAFLSARAPDHLPAFERWREQHARWG